MNILWQALYLTLWFFYLLMIARIVVEFVRMLARGWLPSGRSAITVEVIYTVTDPPLRALRRVIPMVRIGNVGIDLSLFLLLIVIQILILPLLFSLAANS
ncbi:YggT family protein [Nakamurella antarctica]|uniref:YggT family protein n=1 Tax=Nakamurella antarctica TaxID=1902245 RepID=A0A3G8ZK85_9ACTN|nr:YggT family protein [Nakamurella antarctica]AZI57673.1 YggT family protein [Nakamurella antarctica]